MNVNDAWNFDLTALPRDGTFVILACQDGVTVTKSQLLPEWGEKDGKPKRLREAPRWEGLAVREEPIAWMLYPTHPRPGP